MFDLAYNNCGSALLTYNTTAWCSYCHAQDNRLTPEDVTSRLPSLAVLRQPLPLPPHLLKVPTLGHRLGKYTEPCRRGSTVERKIRIGKALLPESSLLSGYVRLRARLFPPSYALALPTVHRRVWRFSIPARNKQGTHEVDRVRYNSNANLL